MQVAGIHKYIANEAEDTCIVFNIYVIRSPASVFLFAFVLSVSELCLLPTAKAYRLLREVF